jgi:arsenate reductase
MSDTIKVYQKPTCSKCRATLKILEDRGIAFEPVNYYDTPLTASELKELLVKLGVGPRDILRKGETAYSELDLSRRSLSDDELIALMVKHPDLIQRPIVVKGGKAVLARPPENVEELL